MEDKKSYLQLQADEIQKWGIKIDELKAKVDETKAETRSKLCEQIDELRMKTESARDNLIKEGGITLIATSKVECTR